MINAQVVLTEDARRFADQMGILLFETSAKDNINVEEMFRAITELVLKSKKVSEFRHHILWLCTAEQSVLVHVRSGIKQL